MTIELPSDIIKCIHIVSAYASDETSWNKVKTELMSMLPMPLRSLFSNRDPSSRELQLNEFEIKIIEYWKSLTGNELKVMPVQWKINRRTGKPVGRPRKVKTN